MTYEDITVAVEDGVAVITITGRTGPTSCASRPRASCSTRSATSGPIRRWTSRC